MPPVVTNGSAVMDVGVRDEAVAVRGCVLGKEETADVLSVT